MNVPNLVGKAAPNFELKSLDGKSYSLPELKNKVILLDFWTSWCQPCRQEIPAVHNLYNELKQKDFFVIGVDVGEDRKTVEKFLSTAGISYPVALTSGTDIASDYHATSYPTYIVIGRDGVVVGEQVGRRGEPALRELVAKAYGQSLLKSRVAESLAAARSARSSDNFAAAEQAYNAALEAAISRENAQLASVALQAATFFEGQKQPEKAEAVLKRALDAEVSSGPPLMKQIPILMRLRQVEQSLRNVNLVSVDTRLVKAWESGPGPESVVVARSLYDLSDSLLQNGQLADAERAIQRSIAILEKTYGSNAPQLRFALSRLSSIETRLGKADLAREARNREAATLPQPSAPTLRGGGGVTSPRVTFKRDPEYSAAARNAGIQGSVMVSLVVDTNGTAADVTVVVPLGEGLDEKAVEAVKEWRFEPGTKDGQPVRVAATISVEFRLLP
jgi:TonB family protein